MQFINGQGEIDMTRRITIIGGGASGTVLAINLLHQAQNSPIEINIVEKDPFIGKGVAYSTTDDVHLLNVPAAKMGVFADDIEHFYKWLQKNDYEYSPGEFVPRRVYGIYLRDTLANAIANRPQTATINLIKDEAIGMLTEDDSAIVMLRSGEALPCHNVVLAFGNFLPPDLNLSCTEYTQDRKYFRNAWDREIFDSVRSSDDVLIIGTGLTAVDRIMSLERHGHKGRVVAISTHGWLPAQHEAAEQYPSFADDLAQTDSIRGMLKIIRRHCKESGNWRGVIDSLRPATQHLWTKLSLSEKRRFMRHLRRVWDISRHRMPPQCMETLVDMQKSGRLKIKSGAITSITRSDGGFIVEYRKGKRTLSLKTSAIINCVGSESDFSKIDVPFVKSLLENGNIECDDMSMGVKATGDGRIVLKDRSPSNVVSVIGTALKGILWESTAMPEIRTQARSLASRLLAE